jgi:hypothetical protein
MESPNGLHCSHTYSALPRKRSQESDVDAMGFPLSIAAASYLVQKTGGLNQSGSYSWMVPDGKEVRVIAKIEA